MVPHPSGIFTSVTKTPQPFWKSSFSRRKTIKVKEWGILWLVRNGFHQKLVCFCFHLYLSDLATLKHTKPPQSNLICNFYSSLTLNEIDIVNKSVGLICEFTLIRASLRIVICLHGRNVDRIYAILCGNAIWWASQTFNYKIKAKQRENKNSEFWIDNNEYPLHLEGKPSLICCFSIDSCDVMRDGRNVWWNRHHFSENSILNMPHLQPQN